MNSKDTAFKIVELLKQVAPEGATKKQQWNSLFLMLKRIEPSIPKLRFSTGKSIIQIAQQPNKEAIERVMKTIPPNLQKISLEQQRGMNEEAPTVGEIGDGLSLDTDLLSPYFQLKGLNPAQIKGWAKIEATGEGQTLKKVLVEVAENLGIASGGKIDELTQAIYDKINE